MVKIGSTDALDWASAAALATMNEPDTVKASAVLAGYFALAIEAGRKAGRELALAEHVGVTKPVSSVGTEFAGFSFNHVEQLVFSIASDNSVEVYVDGVTALRINTAHNVAVVDTGVPSLLRGYPMYPRNGRAPIPLGVVTSDGGFFDQATGDRMPREFAAKWKSHYDEFPVLAK